MANNFRVIKFGVSESTYAKIRKEVHDLGVKKFPVSVVMAAWVRMVLEDWFMDLRSVAEAAGNRITVRECKDCGAIGTGAVPIEGEAPPWLCLNCLCNKEQF